MTVDDPIARFASESEARSRGCLARKPMTTSRAATEEVSSAHGHRVKAPCVCTRSRSHQLGLTNTGRL